MSSVPYGLMIILLTWSTIISANEQHTSHDKIPDENISNDQLPPKSLLERIFKTSVEQDESSNKLRKRAVANSQLNQLSYDYFYNQRFPQPAVAVQISPYSMYPSWQSQVYQNPPIYQNPPVYQENRPIYYPAWNSIDRMPTYFQPQPVYYNFGYPIDNPPIDHSPPEQGCHTRPCPSTGTGTGVVSTDGRFNEDGPVWDTVAMKPTRPTRRPGQGPVTFPPLIHNSHDTDLENQHGVAHTFTTPRPVVPSEHDSPSKCVWAIVSCCSATSNKISYSCFEQLGCTGAFWDSNPCESEFAHAAISNVMKYYQSK